MKVDEDDFRLRYAELSDEGLLSINREELVDLARQCYDEELPRANQLMILPLVSRRGKVADYPADRMFIWSETK
jgi:hypothetical protein